MQHQPFNLDPIWTAIFVGVVLIGLVVLVIWQRRKDRERKLKAGDSVQVVGAREIRHITDVVEGDDEYFQLEGFTPHTIFAASALSKRD